MPEFGPTCIRAGLLDLREGRWFFARRNMQKLKWMVLLLALIQGGWLVYDGVRAFVVGDYLTPKSGNSAGQLGPWARVVTALGFDPRSPVIKSLHVGLGLAWLLSSACWVMGKPTGWWMLLGCSVGTIWYMPMGTLVSLVQAALLLLLHVRGHP